MNNTIAYIIALAILTPVVIIGAVIALNNTDQEPITQQPIKVQNQRVQTIALQEPEVAGITLASQPITQHQYPRVAPIQEQVKVQQPVKSVKQAEPQTKEVITGTQTLDVYERYYGVKAQKDGRFWVFKVGNKWYYHYQIDRDDKNIRIHEGTPDVEYYREDGTKKQTDRFFRDMLADRIYWHADGKTKKTHERYSRGELSSIKHYNADGTEVQTPTPEPETETPKLKPLKRETRTFYVDGKEYVDITRQYYTLDDAEKYYGVKAQRSGKFHWVFKIGNTAYYHSYMNNMKTSEVNWIEYYREDGTKKQKDRFLLGDLAERKYYHTDGTTLKKTQTFIKTGSDDRVFEQLN